MPLSLATGKACPAAGNVRMSDSTALPCATCGYDLRVTPREGICPECATPVEKAIELAKIPIRPAWRDSDPRWRRRMVAGAWVMVFVPLVEVLLWSDLGKRIPVVSYDFQGFSVGSIDTSFFAFIFLYVSFCVGVVLFFAREQYRRRNPLDWTRRWGVFVSYAVLIVGVPYFAVVTSLVMVGISALFMSLPYENQPAVAGLVRELGIGYLLYAPHGSDNLPHGLAVLSACAILLACASMYQALRSTGPRALAAIPLIPLALAAVWQIGAAAIDWNNLSPLSQPPPFFFAPGYLRSGLDASTFRDIPSLQGFLHEVAKWLPFVVIALWLSIAQLHAWRRSAEGRQPA